MLAAAGGMPPSLIRFLAVGEYIAHNYCFRACLHDVGIHIKKVIRGDNSSPQLLINDELLQIHMCMVMWVRILAA